MCCGRSLPSRPVTPIARKSAVEGQKKVSAVKPLVRTKVGKRCERCSHLTMSIYVAGRERFQCTNSQCRAIAK